MLNTVVSFHVLAAKYTGLLTEERSGNVPTNYGTATSALASFLNTADKSLPSAKFTSCN